MRYLSITPLIGGAIALLLALLALASGHWLNATAFLVAGALLAIRSILRPPMLAEIPVLELGATLFTVISVVTAFIENKAFHPENASAHIELFTKFTETGTQKNECSGRYSEFSTVLRAGISSCALQDSHNMISAISDLKKAESFGPALSVLDGVVSSSSQKGLDACYESYIQATNICPGVFGSISSEAMDVIQSYKETRHE